MPDIRFEWDEKKHSVNKRKHGVTFTEGQTAFADENGLLIVILTTPTMKRGSSFSV
jgi:uncharacterized DUF497 family protein